ncbi:hypothetical protein D9757_011930 [Collybiopsis confluens]|uniref:DUF6536 domain-containing protein n=1 Tax=Collybiopsis confluens TaxID=2823264 RepID=A0A8H5LRN4_9AGAR|nr:hypothetical protein D9757_011930 [Collybiopsis confluens]
MTSLFAVYGPAHASVSPNEDSPEGLAFGEREGEKQHWRSSSNSGISLLGSGDRKSHSGSRHRSVQNQMRRSITRIKSKLPTGWRFGAWLAVFQASAVLLTNIVILVCNIVILVWSATKSGGSAIGIAFQGDCNTVDQYSVGIHLVINVLSTVLLGASNYMMQTLCAPTRAEVDRAHKKGIWLDIGLQSIRNLKYASRMKRILWVALSISSIPLHLLCVIVHYGTSLGLENSSFSYNSSFFSTISAEEYPIILAIGPGLRTMTPNTDGRYNWTCGYWGCPLNVSQAELSQWDVLNAAECLKAYATDFVSDRSTVVLVLGDYVSNDTLITLETSVGGGIPGMDPYDWICSGVENEPLLCTSAWRSINPSTWAIVGDLDPNRGDTNSYITLNQVNYCLSQPVVPECQLNFNVPLLVLVIMFNIVKVTCMALAIIKIHDNALVTIGDAITSFSSDPDIHTRNMCLASNDIFQGWQIGEIVCLEYQLRRIRWFRAASKRHWMTTLLFFAAAISIVLGLLIYGIFQLGPGTGFSTIWELGIGKAHAQTIISRWKIPTEGYSALMASVLVSNSPQLILSIIYLIFNSLCTNIFLAREWFSYSHTRKGLRVSIPQGAQRSTYFLQIPYRFGLPLIAYSTLLHWLVSQSIFLVRVTYYNPNPQLYSGYYETAIASNNSTISSCGYSPFGMILTLITSGTLILGVLIIGFFAHFNGDMPFVGSCSAAISASCHPPIPEGSDPFKPMKWGAVIGPGSDDGKQSSVGHVSFSSGDVFEPIPGCYYS